MNNMEKNILLVGVGGQGTLLVSKILSEGLMEAGYDVKMSEIHGMSQRGGSVSTHIKFGKKVYSPVIAEGEADILVSFEQIEALRALPYLKKGGMLVVNDQQMNSMPIITGEQDYPEGVIEYLHGLIPDTLSLDAGAIAQKLGNSKAQNVVLLGAMVKKLGLSDMDWPAIIARMVPEKFRELNLKAYQAGYAL